MDEIEKKEEWYLNIDYREAKEIIRNKLQGMTQNFIGIGFYLRQIKESEGFRKDGYASVYEFAEDQYGIKRSTAIRWMQMNEKFSQGGYSPFLDSGYKDFGKSQLQEMLYLDSEQLEEVTPEMTVREIREIRTPDPEPEEQLPGQMSVEDFPEVLPEQEEQQTEETKVELQGDVEGNALVLKAVTEDEAGTMFFSLDNMKFNLLDDGKLCLIAEDDAEESDDGEEADDSETGEVDFSVKTYFEKIIVTE